MKNQNAATDGTKKFYYVKNGNKVEFNNFENNTYSLGGYQNESDKGKLSIIILDNGSTCLTPIFNKDGSRAMMAEKAGKTLWNGVWR